MKKDSGNFSSMQLKKLEKEKEIRGERFFYFFSFVFLVFFALSSYYSISPLLQVEGFDPIFGRGLDAFHQILGPPKEYISDIWSIICGSESRE